jgi:hypothetical protein
VASIEIVHDKGTGIVKKNDILLNSVHWVMKMMDLPTEMKGKGAKYKN